MVRSLVKLITFIGGLFFLMEFVLPAEAPKWLGGFGNPLTPYLKGAENFTIIVGAMAFLLGPINLVRSHVTTLRRREKGWLESVMFLLFLVAGMLAQSLAETPEGKQLGMDRLQSALLYGVGTAFFTSSMALLAFYLVSAAHRAFRMNSIESSLMMGAAVVVLLGQVPVGDWLTQNLPEAIQLRCCSEWILQVPNTGVQRAVIIGAAGGAMAASLRHWLGLGKGMQ